MRSKPRSGADEYVNQYDTTVDQYRKSNDPKVMEAVENYDRAKQSYLKARTNMEGFLGTGTQKSLNSASADLLSAKEFVESVVSKNKPRI